MYGNALTYFFVDNITTTYTGTLQKENSGRDHINKEEEKQTIYYPISIKNEHISHFHKHFSNSSKICTFPEVINTSSF